MSTQTNLQARLLERQQEYVVASERADEAAAKYVEMRARGVRSVQVEDAMDVAQADLRRASRRLREVQRRLQGLRA